MSHMPPTSGPVAIDLTRGIVSVRDYGATGDGVVDDTTAFQNAINTGKTIVGRPGDTYIINGGLIASTVGQMIDMTGCVVKLKNSAGSKNIVQLTGAGAKVIGGEWNMNAANNSSGSVFDHSAVLLSADYTIAERMYVHDSFGIGIGGPGNASYREIRQCRLENCAGYGVFIDGPTTADAIGTRITGCTVVTTTTTARGLYIQSLTPFTYQSRNWIVQGNIIIGPSANSTAVGITCSGVGGLTEGNHVKNWDIGISIERSISTRNVVANNRVESDYVSYGGIEVVGGDCVISGNYVRGHGYGIVGSTTLGTGETIDGSVLIGNRLQDQTIHGIYVAPATGDTARRQSIVDNIITATTALGGLIRLSRDCQYSLIQGNILKGSGSAGGRGVFLESVNANVLIRGNRFAGLQRAVTLYNVTATAYTNIGFIDNDVSEDVVATGTQCLNLEGTAVYGAACQIVDTFTGFALTPILNIWDCANNISSQVDEVSAAPEGAVTSGAGSTYGNSPNGKIWTKESGAGNTGWKPVGFVPRTAPTYGANVAIATLGYTGEFVVTATNGNAFQIDNPTTPVAGARITIRIRNTSGGALGVVTFGTAYKLAAWVSPATANSRSIDFQYDGTNWIEVSRTPADVPT